MLPDDPGLKKKTTLKALLKEAKRIIDEKEEMWAPFSQQRLRPHAILLELTRIIDKRLFDVTVQEVIINTDEEGVARVEVTGVFQSKTGIEHFKHFSVLEKSFEESRTLTLTEEIDPTLADDKGVKFTARLKLKEVAA